ncbi:thermonuclease family protein [Demequina aurantiaca]|uniref:thermonuclease family protein n=1 Tax=Demequina aurantiaca TaxID=676200 RepID=UPI003D3483FF
MTVLRRRSGLTAVAIVAMVAALTACTVPASDVGTNGVPLNPNGAVANSDGLSEAPADPADSTDPSGPADSEKSTETMEPAPDLGQGETVTITRVVDGDTVYTSNGGKVRLLGYDTPEHGECGFDEAKKLVTELVDGRSVTLFNPANVDDEDHYGRWLRYVEFEGQDLGTAVLNAGMAQARYDGLDGYDTHPLQDSYRSIDAATRHICR